VDSMNTGKAVAANRYEVASYVIAGVGLLLVMTLHLLPALIAGFLVYELVHTWPSTSGHQISQCSCQAYRGGASRDRRDNASWFRHLGSDSLFP